MSDTLTAIAEPKVPANTVAISELFGRTEYMGLGKPDQHIDICPCSFEATRKVKEDPKAENGVRISTGWTVTFHTPTGDEMKWFASKSLLQAGVATKHTLTAAEKKAGIEEYAEITVTEMGMSVKDFNGKPVLDKILVS